MVIMDDANNNFDSNTLITASMEYNRITLMHVGLTGVAGIYSCRVGLLVRGWRHFPSYSCCHALEDSWLGALTFCFTTSYCNPVRLLLYAGFGCLFVSKHRIVLGFDIVIGFVGSIESVGRIGGQVTWKLLDPEPRWGFG
jgi:hypothetical protein